MPAKRLGLYLAIFFQAAGIVLGIDSTLVVFFPDPIMGPKQYLISWVDTISVVIGLIAIPFLWSIRKAFPARIGRISWAVAALVFVGGFTATTLITWYFGRHLPGVTPQNLVLHGLGIDIVPELKGPHAAAVVGTIASVFYGIFSAIAVYLILRGYRMPNTWTAEHEVRLRELLQEYGGNDSLSYFATRRDKQTVFSPDHRAAITYRMVGSVCLASSDPVGDPASWGAAIRAWMRAARTYGWVPAAISVSEAGARAFAKEGLSITRMGDEAVLTTDRFSLITTSLTQVRQACQRVRKAGVQPAHPPPP